VTAVIAYEEKDALVSPIVFGPKSKWAPFDAEEVSEPKADAALDSVKVVKQVFATNYDLYARGFYEQYAARVADIIGTPGPNTTVFIDAKRYPSIEEQLKHFLTYRDQWLVHSSSTCTFKARHQGSFVLQTFVSLSDSTTSAPVIPELEILGPDPLADYEKKYAKPNWDFYGAEPIIAETIEAARYILAILPSTFGAPHISPGCDGTVGLEWVFQHRKLRKLYIDIGPSYTWKGFWRLASGEHQTILPKPIDLKTEAELAALFNRLND
jgi:hypothetical protein